MWPPAALGMRTDRGVTFLPRRATTGCSALERSGWSRYVIPSLIRYAYCCHRTLFSWKESPPFPACLPLHEQAVRGRACPALFLCERPRMEPPSEARRRERFRRRGRARQLFRRATSLRRRMRPDPTRCHFPRLTRGDAAILLNGGLRSRRRGAPSLRRYSRQPRRPWGPAHELGGMAHARYPAEPGSVFKSHSLSLFSR